MRRQPDVEMLRRVLLEDSQPDPGLADRVLARWEPAPPATPHRRRTWTLGAVAAVALAALVVVTLVVARHAVQRSMPAATPSPAPRSTPTPSRAPLLSTHRLGEVAFADSRTGWVVEYAGTPGPSPVTVLGTTDGGAHWTRQLDFPSGAVTLRAGPGAGQGLAVADSLPLADGSSTSSYYTTVDGGAHWLECSPPPGVLVSRWWQGGREEWVATAPSRTAAGAPAGPLTVYHTTDGGRTWQRQTSVDPAAAFGGTGAGVMSFLDSGRAVFVPLDPRSRRGVYVTADGGVHWQFSPPAAPPGVTLSPADNAPFVVAALPDGQVVLEQEVGHAYGPDGKPAPGARAFAYVSLDGGAHWSEARPLPAQPSIFSVAPDGHWWDVTPDGHVSESADQGLTWTPAGSLPAGFSLRTATFTSARDGLVTGSYGGDGPGANAVFVTSDGARTWRPVPPPDPA